MWLLNTETYELRNFVSAEATSKYAILSHCWRDGEVSFADIQDLLVAKTRHGWSKIANACQYAKDVHHHAWIWIDTCCIDKASSAELSEAINSMFAWYRDAAVCIVYLDDVPAGQDPPAAQASFRESRWFRRGWTLQELIAPSRDTVFLVANWTYFNSRFNLAEVLEGLTGVDAKLLRMTARHPNRMGYMRSISVARRMSWAAGRQTTRPEDRAYSLMGLFDVVIPILYGEGGSNAFRRLQLEILRGSNDQTLFAWGVRMAEPVSWRRKSTVSTRLETEFWYPNHLLATSPDDFASASRMVSTRLSELTYDLCIPPIREPHFFDTNYGIRMRVPLRTIPNTFRTLYCAALPCYTMGEDRHWLSLVLARVDSTDVYYCVSLDQDDLSNLGNPTVRLAWLTGFRHQETRPFTCTRWWKRLLGWLSTPWTVSTIYIVGGRIDHTSEGFAALAFTPLSRRTHWWADARRFWDRVFAHGYDRL